MKFSYSRQRITVKEQFVIINRGGPNITKENIKKHLHSMKNPLQLNNNHFLRIILIWLIPTTTSVWCITTWVNIRKHFRITKKHLQSNNNHFLRIILIWRGRTSLIVSYITALGNTRNLL